MKILLVCPGVGKAWKEFGDLLKAEDRIIIKGDSCKRGFRLISQDPDISLIFVNSENIGDCGREFLRTSRVDRRIAQIPKIVVGTRFEPDVVAEYLNYEVFDIIVLPVEKETLDGKILRADKEGRPTILVVDDDPDIAGYLQDLFELERFRVVVTHSVEEAIASLQTNSISAIVSDILMPGQNGFDLLIHVKSEFPQIPVILITGYSGKYGPTEAIAMGADGYFTKPFKNLEMIYALKSVLSKYSRNPVWVKSEA
jgi:CheY-like chemotaxis protein